MAQRDTWLWRVLARLPIFRRLHEVPPEALKDARDEILTTTIFAAMPFWFPIIGYVILVQPPAILESVRNGELLIYAATLVGPLSYIITKRYGRYATQGLSPDDPGIPLSYPFPESRASVTASMIICIIAGIVVTLQKIQNVPALKGIQLINTTGLAFSSLALLLFSTALIFCVSAYRNFIETLSQTHAEQISRSLTTEEDALATEWLKRKKGS